MKKIIMYFIFILGVFRLSAQNIYTVAGDSVQGYNGDTIQATIAELYDPGGIALDGKGLLYIADYNNGRVRKVDLSTGIITTIAGSGLFCHYSDPFSGVFDIACDTSGNIFVSDVCTYKVYKIIAATRAVSIVAGNGVNGSSGNGGQATNAELSNPTGVAIDANGNIYIADVGTYTIRKVNTSTGIISVVAGTGIQGYNGDGIAATSAELDIPSGVAFDASGNMYIADNNRIRKISSSTGLISTIAGTGTAGYNGDGIAASAAELNAPENIAIDAANDVFIADGKNERVRKITITTGIISTVAGDSVHGYNGDGIPAVSAELYFPTKVAIDNAGIIYIADTWNNRIRKITPVPLGIKELAQNSNIKIHPNPSTGIFIFELQEVKENTSVEIYNMLGEKVYNSQCLMLNSQYLIDLSNQPAGIYLYRIVSETGEQIATGKLVIQK